MSCFDDDDDKKKKSKKRKEEEAPPSPSSSDDDDDSEGSDGASASSSSSDGASSSSGNDDDESFESESASEEEDVRLGGKQKSTVVVVVASVPRSALGGSGRGGSGSGVAVAASACSLPQIDRKRFMSSKTSEVAAEVSGRGFGGGNDGCGDCDRERRRGGAKKKRGGTLLAGAADADGDESGDGSRLPTREEFSRMQRDVEELGALGLDKRSRGALEARRLAALGFSPLQPRTRVPASIGFGQAAARRRHAAAALEAALDEGLVQRKGLSKKRKKERELEDEASAGRNKRKKRRRVTFNSEEHVFCGVPTKKPVYFSSTTSMMTSKCRSNKVSWRERV